MVRVVPKVPLVIVPSPPVTRGRRQHAIVLSLSVTVKVSPVVLPVSDRLTPVIAVAWPTPIVCAGRHSNHRQPGHRHINRLRARYC